MKRVGSATYIPITNPMSNFSAGYNFIFHILLKGTALLGCLHKSRHLFFLAPNIFLKLLVITKEHNHHYDNENLTKLKKHWRKDQSNHPPDIRFLPFHLCI